jgi:hypothetical protein
MVVLVVDWSGSSSGRFVVGATEAGCRGDDPADASGPGESRGEQGPVIVVERWPVDLAAEHLELVAKHDDLKVRAASGTYHETGPAR